MFKFGRFKTSFNVCNSPKRKSLKEYDGFNNTVSINGAYRTNREEIFIYNNNAESQKKPTPLGVLPPAPPPIPPEPAPGPLRQTKSTSDLIRDKNLPPALQAAQSGISLDPRGADADNRNSKIQTDPNINKKLDAQKRVEKQRLEEQKKLEKQRLAEQKKLEKQRQTEEKKFEKRRLEEQTKRAKNEMQERAREEKLRKDNEKREAQLLKKNKKKAAPQAPLANPLAQVSRQTTSGNPLGQPSGNQYSTNTLDSSISKTSGPPPYSELPKPEREKNKSNNNISYGKPVDTGSWDMISQHRQDLSANRTVITPTAVIGKQTTLDLNYTLGNDNSEV